MNQAGISAVIITRNEEIHIANCINSIKDLVDEVIVVDSGSKDRTVEIAKDLGAKVIMKAWEGYGTNKNYGADQSEHDWILSIDADEVADKHLRKAIKEKKLIHGELYLINNITNYCGHWVKYTEWKPMYKYRLYQKSNTRWNQRKVHEGLTHQKEPKFVKLPGAMLHYSYTDYQEHLKKTEQYARLSAEQWIEEKKSPGILKRIFGPSLRFIKSYVFKLGFLEGKVGYTISRTNALQARRKIQYFDQLKKGGK